MDAMGELRDGGGRLPPLRRSLQDFLAEDAGRRIRPFQNSEIGRRHAVFFLEHAAEMRCAIEAGAIRNLLNGLLVVRPVEQEILEKTNGDTDTEKMISAMEGMSWESPKGKMTFRKDDHQALQSMYHIKLVNDPAYPWVVPKLVREIGIAEMDVPIRNKK